MFCSILTSGWVSHNQQTTLLMPNNGKMVHDDASLIERGYSKINQSAQPVALIYRANTGDTNSPIISAH